MNQVGTRNSDHEPNTAVVEIRLTRDEEVIHAHNQGVQVPSPDGGISSHSTHTEESIERTIMPNIMPQLDGPASVCTQRRQALPITRRTTVPGDGFPDDSDSDSRGYTIPVKIRDTQEKDIIEKEMEDLLIEKITRVEVIQEEEDPLIMENP